MTEPKPRLVIIDGNAIIHRAYHALPPMTNKSGLLVNAVYGFTSMLIKTLNDLAPTHMAVTFDLAGPTFRHEAYKEYKATRVKADQELYDQIPLVKDVVRAFNIPIYEATGFEADDVIGTIALQVAIQKNGPEVIIVTGDKDTLQLVGPFVRVYSLRQGLSDGLLYDTAAVIKRFGFGPEHMVDFKALSGDSSDNIPGVPGIGEKTATDLICTYGSLKNIYAALKKHPEKFKTGVKNKLLAGEESAYMSFSLATIKTDVPKLNFSLPSTECQSVDATRITEIFQRLEFTSLLRRVPGLAQSAEAEKPKSARGRKKASEFIFRELKTAPECAELATKIIQEQEFGCRALLSGADIFSGEVTGFICALKDEAAFIPAKYCAPLKEVFSNEAVTIIGHDLKQLVKILAIANETTPDPSLKGGGAHNPPLLRGGQPARIATRSVAGGGGVLPLACQLFDVSIASYLLHPGSRAHDVSSIVLKTLGKELILGSGQESLFGRDIKQEALELSLVVAAAGILKKELVAARNIGLFNDVEMPLIEVLANLELSGVAIDKAKLAVLSKKVVEEVAKTTKKIFALSGREFNISSPLQLREILFEDLAIPTYGVKKGKTGLSTDAEQLEKLRGQHPIIDEIENYRELTKLQNTYIDTLPALINKTTGRIHTTFNQAVTATGRLSSSDPNLQNIPIRTALGREIRAAFVAPAGRVLMSVDYSQIELRIVASLAEDTRMMEIFDKGEDIHTATAAAIHGVALGAVTKDMRRSAKEINFGILYGMGAYGLAWRADISRASASDFIAKYFKEFSGVKKYIERTLEFAKQEGYVETLFGRRRYIPELRSGNFQLRAQAERMAINHPVQGTAADLMKMAMIAVSQQAMPEFTKEANMILQVHDELVFEADKKVSAALGVEVKKVMENVVKLRVPIQVDVGFGDNWGELH